MPPLISSPSPRRPALKELSHTPNKRERDCSPSPINPKSVASTRQSTRATRTPKQGPQPSPTPKFAVQIPAVQRPPVQPPAVRSPTVNPPPSAELTRLKTQLAAEKKSSKALRAELKARDATIKDLQEQIASAASAPTTAEVDKLKRKIDLFAHALAAKRAEASYWEDRAGDCDCYMDQMHTYSWREREEEFEYECGDFNADEEFLEEVTEERDNLQEENEKLKKQLEELENEREAWLVGDGEAYKPRKRRRGGD